MRREIIILTLIATFALVLPTVIAETNVTLLYGYNGTAWVPLKSDSSGVLQSNLNLTSTVSAIPRTDNLYDLGSSSFRWKAIFGMQEALGLTTAPISTLDISGNISVAGTTNSSINGSTFFVDATDSRIGINTTTPLQELNVVGQVNITGRIILNGTTLIRGVSDTWPSADGSANNVLTTNGAGILSWLALSSIASNGWTASGSNLYNSTANVNVGIGTSSPASLLHISGSGTNLFNVSNSTYSFLLVNTSGTYTGGATIAKSVDNQTFTASGTWTKPVGAKMVRVILIGGGGGGGGGSNSAGYSSGGGGGGGGALVTRDFDPSALGSTETVTVGSGGIAGAAYGNGGVGGTSSFGSHISAYGGGAGQGTASGGGVSANGGGGGGWATVGSAGSTNTGGAGGTPRSNNTFNDSAFGGADAVNSSSGGNAVYGGAAGGGTGGTGSTNSFAGGSSLYGCPGGGGGGNQDDNGGTRSAGGAGGTINTFSAGGGGAGGAAGANAGTAGTSRSGTSKCGDGGGGAGGNNLAGGSTGGAGGVPGGAGGGGGAGSAGGGGGAGSAGGRGEVIVYTYY